MNQIFSNWSRLQNCNSALGSSVLKNITTVNCGCPAIQPTKAMSYNLDKAGKLARSMWDTRISNQWLWKWCLLACNVTEIYRCFWMSLLRPTYVPKEPTEGSRFLWKTSKFLSHHTALSLSWQLPWQFTANCHHTNWYKQELKSTQSVAYDDS